MNTNRKNRKLVWISELLLGIGLAVVIVLLAIPWSMADAAGLPDGVEIEGVAVIRCTVSDAPEMVTVEDDESCQRFADCLRGSRGRWSGFAGKNFIQDHGVSYELYIRCSDEQSVHCRLFDGKLYCESFRFTLSGGDAARLTQCITELMETAAE